MPSKDNRLTVILPPQIEADIEALCVLTKRTKSAETVVALEAHLHANGFPQATLTKETRKPVKKARKNV